VEPVTYFKLAALANKVKKFIFRGKKVEIRERTIKIGGSISYHERTVSVPLEPGQATFIDGALEQVQTYPQVRDALEKAGFPHLTKGDLADKEAMEAVIESGERLLEKERLLVSISALLGHGDARFHAEDFSTAEHAYREARNLAQSIGDKSLEATSLNGLGISLGGLGQFEQEMDCYERAIELNPSFAEAWCNKGAALGIMGKYEEALSCFNQALKFNDDLAATWYNKGVALDKLGLSEEALTCYETTIGLKPEEAEAWNNRGTALWRLGRDEEALTCLEEAIKHKPDFAVAWYNKGLSLWKLERLEEALSCNERALELNPGFTEAWCNKGVTLGMLGRHDEALSCFEKATAFKPENAKAWIGKGVALEMLGRYEQAKAALQRSQELEQGKQ